MKERKEWHVVENIFSQVIQAIEGETITMQEVKTADGTNAVKLHWFGPDLWVEKARRGRITAIECLALILFVEDDFLEPLEREPFVMAWANELKAAALNGGIAPRDVETRLPLNHVPANFEWLLFTGDVDKFLHSKGLSWGCVEVIEHLYNQCLPSIERNLLVSLGLPEIGNSCNAAKMHDVNASIKEWISKAQELGADYVAAWKAAGYNPTKADAALYVEGVFSTERIYGDRDEVLDRATIERHALKGITGNPQGYKSKNPKVPGGMRHKLPEK